VSAKKGRNPKPRFAPRLWVFVFTVILSFAKDPSLSAHGAGGEGVYSVESYFVQLFGALEVISLGDLCTAD